MTRARGRRGDAYREAQADIRAPWDCEAERFNTTKEEPTMSTTAPDPDNPIHTPDPAGDPEREETHSEPTPQPQPAPEPAPEPDGGDDD